MSADLTVEIPLEITRPGPVRTSPVDDEAIDRALAVLVEPVVAKPSPIERLGGFVRLLAASPKGAAFLTLWCVAALVMMVALLAQPTRSVDTSVGAAEVDCGLDIYLYGDPDAAVERVCRDAAALNAALFVPAALVVLIGLAAAGVVAITARRMRVALVPAAALLVAVLAGLVGLFALRPVPVTLVEDGAVVSLSCGADSYFGALGKYPDSRIASTCSDAYAGRARTIQVCVALVVVASLVLLRRQVKRSPGGRSWRQLRARVAGATLALAAIALLALAPVTVELGGGPAPQFAACGLDTFLAGHPDRTVQDECRTGYRGHAAIGLLALAGAVVVAGWGAAAVHRQRYSGDALAATPEGQALT